MIPYRIEQYNTTTDIILSKSYYTYLRKSTNAFGSRLVDKVSHIIGCYFQLPHSKRRKLIAHNVEMYKPEKSKTGHRIHAYYHFFNKSTLESEIIFFDGCTYACLLCSIVKTFLEIEFPELVTTKKETDFNSIYFGE